MMGANGFAMGRPFLIAANKTSKSRKLGAQGVVNFVDSLVDDLQMACAIQKQENIKGLRNRRANLFAMSREAGELFGVPFEAKKAL